MVATDTDFWLVWSPQGKWPPRHRHASEQSATHEAERLARLHPGSVFYVVTPTRLSVAPVDGVVTLAIADVDDIPF